MHIKHKYVVILRKSCIVIEIFVLLCSAQSNDAAARLCVLVTSVSVICDILVVVNTFVFV